MNDKIESLIQATAEPGSKNRLSLSQVRQWLSGYLEMYEEEVRRFPDLIGKPHGDVVMADFDRNRPALFMVALFGDETVTFAFGKGESANIRSFLEQEGPADANQLIPELAARFYVSAEKLIVGRQEFADWLG